MSHRNEFNARLDRIAQNHQTQSAEMRHSVERRGARYVPLKLGLAALGLFAAMIIMPKSPPTEGLSRTDVPFSESSVFRVLKTERIFSYGLLSKTRTEPLYGKEQEIAFAQFDNLVTANFLVKESSFDILTGHEDAEDAERKTAALALKTKYHAPIETFEPQLPISGIAKRVKSVVYFTTQMPTARYDFMPPETDTWLRLDVGDLIYNPAKYYDAKAAWDDAVLPWDQIPMMRVFLRLKNYSAVRQAWTSASLYVNKKTGQSVLLRLNQFGVDDPLNTRSDHENATLAEINRRSLTHSSYARNFTFNGVNFHGRRATHLANVMYSFENPTVYVFSGGIKLQYELQIISPLAVDEWKDDLLPKLDIAGLPLEKRQRSRVRFFSRRKRS